MRVRCAHCVPYNELFLAYYMTATDSPMPLLLYVLNSSEVKLNNSAPPLLIKIEHFNGHIWSSGTSVYSHVGNREPLPKANKHRTS